MCKAELKRSHSLTPKLSLDPNPNREQNPDAYDRESWTVKDLGPGTRWVKGCFGYGENCHKCRITGCEGYRDPTQQ